MGRDVQLLLIISVFFSYLFIKLNVVFKAKLASVTQRNWARAITLLIMGLLMALVYIRVSDRHAEDYLPRELFYPVYVSLIFLVQMVPYLLIADVISFPILLASQNKERLRSIRANVFMVVIGLFLLYVPLRIWYDDSQVNVIEMTYQKESLSPDLDGFKIALITDIQLDGFTNEEEVIHYLDKVNAQEPDLILISGDYITETPDYIEPIGKLLPRLKAEYGVFGCAGDHDHWAYRGTRRRGENREERRMTQAESLQQVKESLAKGGVPMLVDENKVIQVGGARIKLTSTNQTYAADISDLELESLTTDTAQYELKIFLNHQPTTRLVHKAAAKDYDLFLAGHTHGGQVRFVYPFFSFSTAGLGRGSEYIRGEYHYEDLFIAVCSGLGMSIAPVRYNCTPDIVMIELGKEGNKGN